MSSVCITWKARDDSSSASSQEISSDGVIASLEGNQQQQLQGHSMRDGIGDDRGRGLLWNLPLVKSKDLGKLGPGFGFGAGCGIGFGVGLVGGAGLGAGFPGLQLGIGIGAGCGIGIGFGYGAGRGIAYDENRRHTNVGKLFHPGGSLPPQDQIDALVDELIATTKKLIKETSKEIEKWR